jgi:hypothetical protein
MMIFSALAVFLSLAVWEGDGHEIKLEGEEDEEEELIKDEKPTVTKLDVEFTSGDAERRGNAGMAEIRTP